MARQELNVFFQKLKSQRQPSFDTVSCDEGFKCTLIIPDVETDKGNLVGQAFTGSERTKKQAITNAAEVAISYLKAQPLYNALQPSDSLWLIISSLLTDEALRKEPEFEGQVLLAQDHTDGWLPIQSLALARGVHQWAAKRDPASVQIPARFLKLVSDQLRSEAIPNAAAANIEVDGELRSIRRRAPYKGRSGYDVVTPLHASNAVALGKLYSCMLLPVDSSQDPREVTLPGGKYYWKEIAGLLGTDIQNVLFHNKIGRQQNIYLHPHELPETMESHKLLDLLKPHLGELPSKRQKTSTEQTASTSEANEYPSNCGPDASLLTEVHQPVLYSHYDSCSLNQRAAWLAGGPVYGNALVAAVKLRPNEWRTPCMVWDSYNLPMFRGLLGQTLPSSLYAISCAMPLLATLPRTYSNPKAWQGASPSTLLERAVSPAVCHKQLAIRCEPDASPSEFRSTGSVHLLGDAAPLTASAEGCSSEDGAAQQTTLNLLHKYQDRLLQLFRAGGDNSNDRAVQDIKVLDHREGDSPSDAAILKVKYRILGKEGPFLDKILEEGSGRLVWGSGSVIPAVEMLIARSGLGGTARCSLRLPPDCWNPFYQHSIRCCLEVQSEARQHFAGVKQDVVKLFDPPMAEQRHRKMAGIVKECCAQSVLDIGCGDARLVEHLLQLIHDGSLEAKAVTGIDIDGQAVRRGLKRMMGRFPELLAHSDLQTVRAYEADTCCQAACKPDFWGEYVGVDIAVFQEVIEHLDPTPLSLLPACILGALRPKAAVISTPNYTYNAVLHAIHGQLLPNGLRNSDHRFEWDQPQFQEWCHAVAEQFGYSVTFDAVGHAIREAEATSDPDFRFYNKDIGASTQVAVFKSNAEESSTGQQSQTSMQLIFDNMSGSGMES